jgi:hypothetical protein
MPAGLLGILSKPQVSFLFNKISGFFKNKPKSRASGNILFNY